MIVLVLCIIGICIVDVIIVMCCMVMSGIVSEIENKYDKQIDSNKWVEVE